jgi:uncharacterized membrane protein YqjE
MSMTENDSSTDQLHPQSLSEALKTARDALSSALHTRLELFVTELEEERERFKQTLLLTVLAVFGFSLGFILLIIFIVAVFLIEGWIIALGCLAFLFLAIGMIAALMLRRKFLTRPGLFRATLDELAKDRDQLRSPGHE